ncbi:MAG: FAD-dependent oxidoreductase [Steroidobacteraceae bacterium]
MNYPELFAPLQRGRLRLRNRIIHAAITTRMGEAQKATEAMVRYYANRAAGGAAAVVTEPLSVASHHKLPYKVSAFDDSAYDSLCRWAAAVEHFDCRLFAQIQDPGRGRHVGGRTEDAIAPSALPDDLSWTVPRELAAHEIERMVEEIAASARRLQRAGFAGVEISAGHGHLFHQFLSPRSNRRKDRYGGDAAGRARFLFDVIAAVRAATAASFVIGVKVPGDDGLPGGLGPVDCERLCESIVAATDVDYLCPAWGTHAHTLDLHLPDLLMPRAPFAAQLRRLRARLAAGHSALPALVAVGGITDPAEAAALRAADCADLIALGRPLITDPAWPSKVAAGRESDIRYCVGCNSCWGRIVASRPVACDNNPLVADPLEVAPPPRRTSTGRRVVVIGGGIAGAEAAWVAAQRGHKVTLFCASADLGGKTRLHAELPGGQHLSSIYDYQLQRAKRAGVALEPGVRAGVDDIMQLRPERIVVATGADMSWPASLPRELGEEGVICDLRDTMVNLRRQSYADGTAVLIDEDGTLGTYHAALRLCQLFSRVLIVTTRDRIAEDCALVNRLALLRHLHHARADIRCCSEVDSASDWADGQLAIRNVYNGDTSTVNDIALVTYSTARQPQLGLLAGLGSLPDVDVLLVGDCRAPRDAMAATREGHAAGSRD